MTRLKIYIAGPVTEGDRLNNFMQACIAQRDLMSCGHAPFNPILSIMHPDALAIPYESWIETDLAWVAVADVVLRLPGKSRGADREVEFAKNNNIPVLDYLHDKWATICDINREMKLKE